MPPGLNNPKGLRCSYRIEPSKPSRSQDHLRSKSREKSAGADGHSKGGHNDVTKDVQPPVPIDVSKTVDALPQRKEEDAKTKSGQGESSHAAESTADTAFAAGEPPDLEALLEERRRKRRELLERLAGTQSGVNSATPSSFEGSSGAQSTGTTGGSLYCCISLALLIYFARYPTLPMPIFSNLAEIRESAAHLGLSTSNSGVDTHAQSSPPAEQRFELGKDEGKSANNLDILPAEIKADTLDGEAQISAADYNPDDDRKLDDERRKVHDIKAHATHSIEPPTRQEIADGLGEPATATANDDDEYEEVEEDVEDEDFDMFAVDEAPKKKRKVLKKKTVRFLFDRWLHSALIFIGSSSHPAACLFRLRLLQPWSIITTTPTAITESHLARSWTTDVTRSLSISVKVCSRKSCVPKFSRPAMMARRLDKRLLSRSFGARNPCEFARRDGRRRSPADT